MFNNAKYYPISNTVIIFIFCYIYNIYIYIYKHDYYAPNGKCNIVYITDGKHTTDITKPIAINWLKQPLIF